MKGKNKLVPRLLGINKESVLRVDEKTKQVLKVWPLTQVRRWAASPNSFTLVSFFLITFIFLLILNDIEEFCLILYYGCKMLYKVVLKLCFF